MEDLFAELDRTGKTVKRKEVQEKIRKAELEHNEAEVVKLLEEFKDLSR